eukprot:6197432-Pleurochrysis_carterae.AAC.4
MRDCASERRDGASAHPFGLSEPLCRIPVMLLERHLEGRPPLLALHAHTQQAHATRTRRRRPIEAGRGGAPSTAT